MKRHTSPPFFLVTFILFILSVSCKDGPEEPPIPTEEQKALQDLTNNSSLFWTVANGGSVEKDGVSQTATYAGFELWLSANNKSYTTTIPNPIFDQSGSWQFVGTNYDKIELTGTQAAADREISFTRNGDNLTLTFSIPVPTNGRVIALAGNYIFTLKRKN